MAMMICMTPARRRITPDCERVGAQLGRNWGACGGYVQYGLGVGRRGQLRAVAHRHELSAAISERLRGAAHQDARGDTCEDPADRTDDAGETSGEADHREDGAAARVCSA